MKIKLILIGGFLGAGKTTSILRLARWLVERCHRVAIIADSTVDLAHAENGEADSFEVEGIPFSSCFYCRLEALEQTICRQGKLLRPDIIIAEVADNDVLLRSKLEALKALYKDGVEFAPYSVVVDPIHALFCLKLAPRRQFAPEIQSKINAQISKAELIVINKWDVVSAENGERIKIALAKKFPQKKIESGSARTGLGCEKWFNLLLRETSDGWPIHSLQPAVHRRRNGHGMAIKEGRMLLQGNSRSAL